MTTAIPSFRTPRPSNTYEAITPDVYPARLVRFIGVGAHEPTPFKDPRTGIVSKKSPAFRCLIQFELIGLDATGTKPDGTPLDPSPACVFAEYYLYPGNNKGKIVDMCKAIDASVEATPRDLGWFKDNLGAVVMVQVGSYQNRDGVTKNTVKGVQPCPGFMKANIGEARSDLVFFNPYAEDEESIAAYNKLFHFQRQMLVEAIDTANIPLAGREPSSTPAGSQQQQSPVQQSQPSMADELGDEESPF